MFIIVIGVVNASSFGCYISRYNVNETYGTVELKLSIDDYTSMINKTIDFYVIVAEEKSQCIHEFTDALNFSTTNLCMDHVMLSLPMQLMGIGCPVIAVNSTSLSINILLAYLN